MASALPKHDKPTSVRMRIRVVGIAVTLASGSVAAGSLTHESGQDANVSGAISHSTLMPDGKQWTTINLNVKTDRSYCYDDAESNCRRYGRLYTWESAQRGCRSLGDRWRLPTNDEWRRLVKHFGGVRDDSNDGGKAAYVALIVGGRSGLNIVFGGGRSVDDQYARVQDHGFYWTASESGSGTAWFYNLGRGGQIVNRHSDGEKHRALSVRCVRE